MVIKQTEKIKNEGDFDKKLETTMKRYLDVLSEDFKDQVRGLSDAIAGVNESLGARIDDLALDMTEIKADMSDIKFSLAIELPNKVDKKLFTHLEHRVRTLEKSK